MSMQQELKDQHLSKRKKRIWKEGELEKGRVFQGYNSS
jgi:hypothetical protein